MNMNQVSFYFQHWWLLIRSIYLFICLFNLQSHQLFVVVIIVFVYYTWWKVGFWWLVYFSFKPLLRTLPPLQSAGICPEAEGC